MSAEKTNQSVMDLSPAHSAMIAGLGLLLMTVLALIADFSILQGLMVPGDAAKTVQNIAESIGSFRLAICFFIMVGLLDILVAWALYVFLKPVHRSLSLLTAWLRIIYAALLFAALFNLVNILHLLGGAGYLSSISTDGLQTGVMFSLHAFNLGWDSGLIVFGFHLLLLGYLIYKAGYMRRILGVLVILSSLGYLTDAFGKLLSPDYNINIAMQTFFGEMVLMVWLIVKGIRSRKTVPHP